MPLKSSLTKKRSRLARYHQVPVPDGLEFLADESCDVAVVRALRSHGYDVAAVSEWIGGASDEQVMEAALTSGRIVLIEDKDFGQLVYANGQASRGVIPIRFPTKARFRSEHSWSPPWSSWDPDFSAALSLSSPAASG